MLRSSMKCFKILVFFPSLGVHIFLYNCRGSDERLLHRICCGPLFTVQERGYGTGSPSSTVSCHPPPYFGRYGGCSSLTEISKNGMFAFE